MRILNLVTAVNDKKPKAIKIFQRYANPYTDENVDRLEFAQLFFAHFLLFLGVVYFALAPNEDEACLALDALSLNATSADDVDQEERARCRAPEDVTSGKNQLYATIQLPEEPADKVVVTEATRTPSLSHIPAA